MEEIQQFLERDERILWEKTEIINQSFSSIMILANTIFFSVLLIVIPWAFYPYGYLTEFDIVMLCIITSILIIVIYISFRIDKKKMKTFNLTRKELRRYEKICILTNKRWIQKNIDINTKLFTNDLPPNLIKRYNDIIIASLDSVKAVMIAESDPENYTIWIYVDESFTEFDDPHLSVEIESWGEYEKFMSYFKNNVPLDEPEEEIDCGIKFICYHRQ